MLVAECWSVERERGAEGLNFSNGVVSRGTAREGRTVVADYRAKIPTWITEVACASQKNITDLRAQNRTSRNT